MEDVDPHVPSRTGEGTGDLVSWRYLELVYDRDAPASLSLDGVVMSGGRALGDVVAELGRDGWEMVGSAPGPGSDHILWFKRPIGQFAPTGHAGSPAGQSESPMHAPVHDVTLVSAGNSWFDPTARARLIAALQELTGQSGWRVGRMVDKAPRVVAERVTQEEADRIRQTLEGLGATVEIG